MFWGKSIAFFISHCQVDRQAVSFLERRLRAGHVEWPSGELAGLGEKPVIPNVIENQPWHSPVFILPLTWWSAKESLHRWSKHSGKKTKLYNFLEYHCFFKAVHSSAVWKQVSIVRTQKVRASLGSRASGLYFLRRGKAVIWHHPGPFLHPPWLER